MSSNDKSLIAGVMEGFVNEVPSNPFVSFCVFCNKGVIKEEMVYEKGKVFHKDCYTKHGSTFPTVNQELLSESAEAKVQLIQLKNLKIRMNDKKGTSKKTKKKSIVRRKLKRKKIKRKKTATRRKKTKKKIKKRITKRLISAKKKTRQKTKRKTTRRVKRRARRRR